MINIFISTMEYFSSLWTFFVKKTREEKEKNRNELHKLIKKKKKSLSF